MEKGDNRGDVEALAAILYIGKAVRAGLYPRWPPRPPRGHRALHRSETERENRDYIELPIHDPRRRFALL